MFSPALRDRDRSRETRGDRPNLQACLGRLVPMPFSVPNVQIGDPAHAAQQPRVFASAAYLAERIAEVPMLVIPCISPPPDGHPPWIAACLWGSVLPAGWNFTDPASGLPGSRSRLAKDL